MSVRIWPNFPELFRVIRSGVPKIPLFATETLLGQPRRLLPTKKSIPKTVALGSSTVLVGLGFTFCYNTGTIEINAILYVLSY